MVRVYRFTKTEYHCHSRGIFVTKDFVISVLWPFAVNTIVRVHNALSSASPTSNISDESSFAVAFALSLLANSKKHGPSPYFNVTQKSSDLSNLRVLFCEVEARIRNKDDLRRLDKGYSDVHCPFHLAAPELLHIFSRTVYA